MEDLDAFDRFTPKKLSFEDTITRQDDRIMYLRSLGKPWSEALYALRDLLVGFEDDEFWDGIPPAERKRIEALPEDLRDRASRRYKELGWDTHNVRAFRGPRGPVFRPTAEELSREYRMIRRLLDRNGMIRKTRKESRLPKEWLGVQPDP